MKRRDLIRAGAATALASVAGIPAGAALAQQKVVWKASDVHPLGYPTVEAIVRMGKKLVLERSMQSIRERLARLE